MSDDSANPQIGKPEFKKIFYHLVLAAKKNKKQTKEFSKKEKSILSRKIDELETNNNHRLNNWINAKLDHKEHALERPKIIPRKIIVVRPNVVKPRKPDNRKDILEIKMHIIEAKKMHDELSKKKGIDKARIQKLNDTIDNMEKHLKT